MLARTIQSKFHNKVYVDAFKGRESSFEISAKFNSNSPPIQIYSKLKANQFPEIEQIVDDLEEIIDNMQQNDDK